MGTAKENANAKLQRQQKLPQNHFDTAGLQPAERNTWNHDGWEKLQMERKQNKNRRHSKSAARETKPIPNGSKAHFIPRREKARDPVPSEKRAEQLFYSPPRGKFSLINPSAETTERTKAIIFVLNIEVDSTGQSESLEVYEGDDPLLLARNFCQQHKMNLKLVDIIAEQIANNVHRLLNKIQ